MRGKGVPAGSSTETSRPETLRMDTGDRRNGPMRPITFAVHVTSNWRNRFNVASTDCAGVASTNVPSLARCSGSRPNSSHTARTAEVVGIRSSMIVQLVREISVHSWSTAATPPRVASRTARGVFPEAFKALRGSIRGAQSLCGGGSKSKRSRAENRRTVTADRTADDDFIAGLQRLRAARGHGHHHADARRGEI